MWGLGRKGKMISHWHSERKVCQSESMLTCVSLFRATVWVQNVHHFIPLWSSCWCYQTQCWTDLHGLHASLLLTFCWAFYLMLTSCLSSSTLQCSNVSKEEKCVCVKDLVRPLRHWIPGCLLEEHGILSEEVWTVSCFPPFPVLSVPLFFVLPRPGPSEPPPQTFRNLILWMGRCAVGTGLWHLLY